MAEPVFHPLTEQLYAEELPELYRDADAAQDVPPFDYPFKRVLALTADQLGAIADLVDRIVDGELGDPYAADPAWLPWLAQRVGVKLDPRLSVAEQRDAIFYAPNGWRGGNRLGVEGAAKLTLTGTRYARFYPHTDDVSAVGAAPWTRGLIVTKPSETPDVDEVLAGVERARADVAGLKLFHRAYEASWQTLEAAYPTSADWDAVGNVGGWQALEETGVNDPP